MQWNSITGESNERFLLRNLSNSSSSGTKDSIPWATEPLQDSKEKKRDWRKQDAFSDSFLNCKLMNQIELWNLWILAQ